MSRGAGGRTFPVLRWPDVALAQDIQQAEHGVHVALVHEERVLALGSSPSLYPLQHLDQELAWPFCNEVRVPAGTGPSAGERRPRSPAAAAAAALSAGPGLCAPGRWKSSSAPRRCSSSGSRCRRRYSRLCSSPAAIPRWPEGAAGPAAGAVRARGGTRASKGARSGSSPGTLAAATGKGEGKTDFPGSRHVSTGTDTPRVPALRWFVGKANYTRDFLTHMQVLRAC